MCVCACVCATVCQCDCQPLRLGRCVTTIVLSVKAIPLLCESVRSGRARVCVSLCVCVCVCAGDGGGGVTVVSEPTPRRLRLGYRLPVGEPGVTHAKYTVMS